MPWPTLLCWDDERVLACVLSEAHQFWEAHAAEQLNVKDLHHGGLEFQHCADRARRPGPAGPYGTPFLAGNESSFGLLTRRDVACDL